MAKQKRRSDCPINYSLELFGDKWMFLIIRDLMFKGKRQFVEFLQSEEKIATNILANRLAVLEENGIVGKSVYEKHKSQRIYTLTPKGIELLPVLVDLIIWSAKYDPMTAVDKAFVERAINDRDSLLKEITDKLEKEMAG